jgi:hypothetical protein
MRALSRMSLMTVRCVCVCVCFGLFLFFEDEAEE